jgi:hypothetical protein
LTLNTKKNWYLAATQIVATIVVAITPHQWQLLGVAAIDPLLAAMLGLSLIRFDQR